MRVTFRQPGPPKYDWHVFLDWPDNLRLPVAGEMVDLPRGQYTVDQVQWFATDDEGNLADHLTVQVILR